MPDFSIYGDSIRSLNRNMRFFLLTAFFVCLAQSVDIVLLNLYLKNRGFSNSLLGEIESMRFWASLLLSVPGGLLSDRIGRKKAIQIAIVFCSLAHILRATVPDPTALMAATFMQGAFYSLLFISISPYIAEQTEPEHRAAVYSLFFAFFTAVGILGYTFGGALPDILHTRGMDLLAGQRLTLVGASIIFIMALIPTTFVSDQRQLNIAGDQSVSSPAEDQEPKKQQGFWQTLRLLPVAERRAIISFTVPDIFSGIGSALVIPLLTIFFSTQHNLSSSTIGMVQAAGELSIIVATVIGPLVSARIGIVKSIALFQIFSAPFLLLMGNASLLPLALLGYLLRNALMNSLSPLKSTLQMQRISPPFRGFAASCAEVGFSLSRALFSGLGGALSESYGFPVLYSVASVFYLLAGTLYYLLNRERQ